MFAFFNSVMKNDTLYFISDAHLGAPFADARQWERRCIDFLRSLHERAAALYILGDLFDFWIEYRYAIRPDYFPVIHELKNLVERGVPVHYFAGNHDFAFGPFIKEQLGITVYLDHVQTVLQGKQVHLYHGDGLLKFDVGYRIMKRLLRNRVNQALYKALLPPSIGIPLGSFCSGTSRRVGSNFMSERIIAEYRAHARSYLDEGSDIVFLAHSHQAELSRWGDKIYCNTGAWMRKYNFATMNNGTVKLWSYHEDGEAEEIQPIERK
jgi:UDP-2,3-diacylglucosamine hydrolase